MEKEEMIKGIIQIINEELRITQVGFVNPSVHLTKQNECAERIANFISSKQDVIKSVCEHKNASYSRRCNGGMCDDCGEYMD